MAFHLIPVNTESAMSHEELLGGFVSQKENQDNRHLYHYCMCEEFGATIIGNHRLPAYLLDKIIDSFRVQVDQLSQNANSEGKFIETGTVGGN